MKKVLKWASRLILATGAAVFLHYTLPQHDIVQVVGTENRRIDFGENSLFWASPDSGTEKRSNRDVFFIQTKLANGSTMVYRNEDTGWDWPPYFKFDSQNLQAEAAGAISPNSDPQYYAITHYGWRIKWFSIFPNAVALKPVAGPDAYVVPWVSVAILAMLAAACLGMLAVVRRFKRRFIQPKLDEAREFAEDGIEGLSAAGDAVAGHARKSLFSFTRWIDTFKGKPRL